MICGIKAITTIDNYPEWNSLVPLEFTLQVNERTAELKTYERNGIKTIIKTAKYKSYYLELIQSTGIYRTSTKLKIRGSIHRNFQGGANYLPLSHYEIVEEINSLCRYLHINPEKTFLKNIEIGLSLPFHTRVAAWLENNLVCYDTGKSFNRFDPGHNQVSIGYECVNMAHYRVKVYDTALKHGITDSNRMRFEISYNKMKRVNDLGIYSLADLKEQKKISPLINLLLSAWNKVLITDSDINLKTLSDEYERSLLKDGDNAKYWYKLNQNNREQYKKRRGRFKQIIAEHGNNLHNKIRSQLQELWKAALSDSPKLPMTEYQSLPNVTNTVKGNNRESHQKEPNQV